MSKTKEIKRCNKNNISNYICFAQEKWVVFIDSMPMILIQNLSWHGTSPHTYSPIILNISTYII